ncbi:MAG: ABC transporter permease [Anaerolineae bacterium]|jgi:ABC-type dipeptide/oligopeptide/nickel transport system permease component
MASYILRRLLWSIPVLLALLLAVFLLMQAIPGGPFDFAGERKLPEAVVQNLEAKYGLDKPLHVQFVNYLRSLLLEGDLGPSFTQRNRTVNDIVGDSLPISAQLGILAIGLALLIGVPAGIIAALNHNRWPDYVASFIAILGVSIPALVLGPVLYWLFALKLGWLPVALWGAERPFFLGFIPAPTGKFIQHAILPTLALGTGMSASIARLTRASLLQVIREDYIRTARAKGLRERAVVVRHALKNSLIPVVTVLGPMFAAVVTGTIVIESVFGIPGMGKYFVQGINNRDYPVIMGVTLIYAVILVLSNLLVDVTYAWLDPRIRYS